MKHYSTLFFLALFAIPDTAFCQDNILDFESFNLPLDTFLNGSDLGGDFIEPNESTFDSFRLENTYDTAFGGYWSRGFAISTMRDDSTAGSGNLYSSIAGGGQNSDAYGVVQGFVNSRLEFESTRPGNRYMGVYLTNSTFAYYSMLQGDGFAKKFGGPTGDDPDYFFIRFYFSDQENSFVPYDSVDFYLADFRSDDNSEDYILNDWVFLDLNDFPAFEYYGRRMEVKLFSSDDSNVGINTPGFFCMDNLEIAYPGGVEDQQAVVPNWTLRVMQESFEATSDVNGTYELYTLSGQKVEQISNQKQASFATSSLPQGIYIIRFDDGTSEQSMKVWRW